MSNFGILLIIFGILTILFGIYIYTGHDNLLGRGYYKKESKEYLKYLGKTIIYIGLSTLICGIISLFVNDNNLLPFIILIILIVIILILSNKNYKK